MELKEIFDQMREFVREELDLEKVRLGRDLTEAEAQAHVETVKRVLRNMVVLIRGGPRRRVAR